MALTCFKDSVLKRNVVAILTNATLKWGGGQTRKVIGKSGSAGILRDIIFVLCFIQMYDFAVEIGTLH